MIRTSGITGFPKRSISNHDQGWQRGGMGWRPARSAWLRALVEQHWLANARRYRKLFKERLDPEGHPVKRLSQLLNLDGLLPIPDYKVRDVQEVCHPG